MQIRRAGERGGANHGWLNTKHTFSFADYYDPNFMGFRALRVINEDRVAADRGFGRHPHANMEILTYVLEGELAHQDSMGNGSVIRPGDVQRMSAGTGVTHSEMNPNKKDAVHFYQIWILPAKQGLAPSYEQKAFPDRAGKLRVVASPDGRDGSVTVHQDMTLSAAVLKPGERVEHALAKGRHAWVQVAKGGVRIGKAGEGPPRSAAEGGAEVDDKELVAGDGAAITGEGTLAISAASDAEVLVFDLA
ncbi:MAG TPA: pirin family protein [Kofleriaceae bacterium]